MAACLLAAPLRASAAVPSHQFGPDTTSTGVYTGTGAGLAATTPAGSDPMVYEGFLRSSVDGTWLDVTVKVPQSPAGVHPLLAYLHGWGGSKGDSSSYDGVALSRGYTVLRYSARGFGESWGQANLADVDVEVADLHSLIGQVVDDARLRADATHVGVFGVSYGGGQSWLAALQPVWTSPAGQTVTVRTVVPIVPWTDLLSSLAPSGRLEQSFAPLGAPKLSYIQALYGGGIRTDPARPYPSYPDYLTQWNAEIAATEPTQDPLSQQIVDALDGYRSIYWQSGFWQRVQANAASGAAQLPVLELQGWTDDLFPVPEALRMYQALKSADPGYPIAEYFGDIGHPAAANKAGELDYALGLAFSWFDYYLRGVGSAPALDVKAAITRPASVPFSSAEVVEAPIWSALWTQVRHHGWDGTQTITWDPANTSGLSTDPVLVAGGEALGSNPPPPPADEVPGDVAVYTFGVPQGMLVAGQPAVQLHAFSTAYRVQLDMRLFDVSPAGASTLVTRGTLTLDSGSAAVPLLGQDVTITSYGNLWQVPAGDTLRLELTNVDSPYLSPSKVPSVTNLSEVRLSIPVR